MRKKRLFTIFIMLVLASALCLPAAAAEDWRNWTHGDARWSSLTMGDGKDVTVGDSGCLATAFTKLLLQSGFRSAESFNVADFVKWMNAHKGFSDEGDLYWWRAAEIEDELCYLGSRSIPADGAEETILQWALEGWHIILEVNDGGHYVLVDNARTRDSGKVYIMDSLPAQYYKNADILLRDYYTELKEAHLYEGTVPWRTLRFDANGGSCSRVKSEVMDGRQITALPTPYRSGCRFQGWYTQAEGGEQIRAGAEITGDMTLYAHWTLREYTIHFDANGGSGAPEAQTLLYGQLLSLSELPRPTRPCYRLLGWTKSARAEKADYLPDDKVAAGSCSRLYALWEPNHQSAEYDRREPTCVENGYSLSRCSSCGMVELEILPALTERICSEWSETPPARADALTESTVQYRFSQRKEFTSGTPNLEGCTLLDSSTEVTGRGSVRYVRSWPEGFPLSESGFAAYDRAAPEAYETGTDAAEVGQAQIVGYIYYHFCRDTYSAGPINRSTATAASGSFQAFHAFFSQTEPHELREAKDGSYALAREDVCRDSYWFYAIPVYEQSYTLSSKLYHYEYWTEWSEWGSREYAAGADRRVESRLVYREVLQERAHSFGAWTPDEKGQRCRCCSVCGTVEYGN